MTRKLAPYFYEFCREEKLDQEYWKIGAAMTAMKLIFGGLQTGLLDQKIGKSIASLCWLLIQSAKCPGS